MAAAPPFRLSAQGHRPAGTMPAGHARAQPDRAEDMPELTYELTTQSDGSYVVTVAWGAFLDARSFFTEHEARVWIGTQWREYGKFRPTGNTT
jgi:hypothetical protein